MSYLVSINVLKIEMGVNLFYLSTLFVIFASSIILFLISSKLNQKKAHRLVLILLFMNFVLHFCKILIPPYLHDFPSSLKVITPDNICAFSAVFFPFMYLSKNKYLRDYMAYLGTASGIAVFLFPGSYLDFNVIDFGSVIEVSRFYISHLLLTLGPVAMLGSKLHTLNHRRAYAVPLIFLFVLTYIGLNEVFLKLSGITNASWQDIFSNNYRNGALVFGPMSTLDESLGKFYFLILPFFKYYYPGTQDLYYIPVLWLALPVFVFFSLGAFLLSLLYTKRQAYLDYKSYKQKRKMRLTYKRSLKIVSE